MKVKSESEVAQSCPTLSDPMDCSLLGSFVHGIFQARVLEWGAIAFSKRHIANFKNTLDEINSRIAIPEEKISELEGITIKTLLNKKAIFRGTHGLFP